MPRESTPGLRSSPTTSPTAHPTSQAVRGCSESTIHCATPPKNRSRVGRLLQVPVSLVVGPVVQVGQPEVDRVRRNDPRVELGAGLEPMLCEQVDPVVTRADVDVRRLGEVVRRGREENSRSRHGEPRRGRPRVCLGKVLEHLDARDDVVWPAEVLGDGSGAHVSLQLGRNLRQREVRDLHTVGVDAATP